MAIIITPSLVFSFWRISASDFSFIRYFSFLSWERAITARQWNNVHLYVRHGYIFIF